SSDLEPVTQSHRVRLTPPPGRSPWEHGKLRRRASICGFPTIGSPRMLKPMSIDQDATATGATIRRLRGGTDMLTAAALRRLDAELAWYRALPAEDRSWIGLVAQSGSASFITWYENAGRGSYNAGEIFRAAPP